MSFLTNFLSIFPLRNIDILKILQICRTTKGYEVFTVVRTTNSILSQKSYNNSYGTYTHPLSGLFEKTGKRTSQEFLYRIFEFFIFSKGSIDSQLDALSNGGSIGGLGGNGINGSMAGVAGTFSIGSRIRGQMLRSIPY